MKYAKNVLCFLLFLSLFPSFAAEGGVVLVLSGGGTRGFAHVGVIEVLEEQKIPVVGIVGTSIGSLIGALSASGYNARELREIVSHLDLPALLTENTGPMFVFTGDDRKAKMNTISALTFKKTKHQGGPLGILTGDKLFQYYRELMKNVDVTDFNELPIPYAAVAADIRTGEKVVLRSGSLPSAMRASMSIPALFEPWEVNGRLLVDGGLVSNLPVDTAMELFPGFPVVGVDVSDIPSADRPINTFIDVIDQSLTVVMRRTTTEESTHADLVIVPSVQEFSFLDSDASNTIIQRGRDAALAAIDKIRALSDSAPTQPSAQREQTEPPIVADVHVQGLPGAICERLRKRFLGWVGKPLNVDEVSESADQLLATTDISTMDYRFDRIADNKVILVLDVRRRSDVELGVSGYTTNLDPYRGVHLKGTVRGVFSEMDSLRGVLRLGEQWAVDLTYLAAPEPLSAWETTVAAQQWKLDTTAGRRNWRRYAAGSNYTFRQGGVRMGLGMAWEYVDPTNGDSKNFAGPTFFAAYDTLDIPADPTKGQAWRVNFWWPNFDDVLYRLTWFRPLRVGEMWRTYLRFGYAEGHTDSWGHAAYLGSAEELYSVAARPVEAERMVWANVSLRRVLKRSMLGIVAADLFASYGYAMDKNYDKIAAPWEVGLSLNLPNTLVNVKIAVMYGSDEFKAGFFLGVPIWDHYPLP
ncbi:MAG: patatin-like phospholipase family protein [Synergistaceae bacterium]|nr:patatin-like phospholipase family protein [Synergistaceae bacterium]